MLARANRLRGSGQIAEVVRRGRRIRGAYVVVHVLLTTTDAPAQVAFAVNRRVGGSVTRHLVSRRLRYAMVQHISELPAGARILVRANPACATASYASLEADLARLVNRIGT